MVNDSKVKDAILVVDDDLIFLKSVSKLLEDEGYKVDTAESGKEALDKSRVECYSLALIDIVLPDFDGIELIEKMEETDPKMRKILITGYQSPAYLKRALTLGINAYLVKPLKTEEILEVVRRQLMERNKELEERYILLKDSADRSAAFS